MKVGDVVRFVGTGSLSNHVRDLKVGDVGVVVADSFSGAILMVSLYRLNGQRRILMKHELELLDIS